MKIGDLVIYKSWASTYEGTGLIHAVEKVSSSCSRYKVSWPGKAAHLREKHSRFPWMWGETMTWESPRDIEVISERR